jgi:predicted nuclease of restriction endonuclease-like (RecB) superfamily
METTPTKISGINDLVHAIQSADQFFLDEVQRQVNTALTLRNWVIGYYIVEYEQNGKDRAEYGGQLFERLAERTKKTGIRGLSISVLHLCVQVYWAYPQIAGIVSKYLQMTDSQINEILRSATGEFGTLQFTPPDILLGKLSFTHIGELVRVDSRLKRLFYETEAIANNWSVRELKRAMDSMLFERTGLSKDKEAVLGKHRKGSGLKPADVFRDPYVLDFLGLEEKPKYVETDLEASIISHLQRFLLEMGRGFCFEGRQKRITFDNTHYRIDLVFYHRLLKCHVLIDLKMGKFTPGDAGQMNMYLNYFKENEAGDGDNPPIGIILCTDKSETLVKYATSGLAQPVFVSRYLTNLPSEKELEKIVLEEQEKVKA